MSIGVGLLELFIILFIALPFVLGALVIFFLYRNARSRSQDLERNMKKCPYCAEFIKQEALVCRYCGRDQPQQIG